MYIYGTIPSINIFILKQHTIDQLNEIQVNFEDNLEVIKEEQNSPLESIVENEEEERKENEKEAFVPTVKCICANTRFDEKVFEVKALDPLKLHSMLRDKELELREEFEKKMEKETAYMKDRFNFILQYVNKNTFYNF